MLTCNIKRKPKKISRSSFACWELSHVNSFSRSCFTFFTKTKTLKTFQCVSLKFFFLFFGGQEEKTMMKMLSGSHMHYCWSNKEPILLCLLLWINVCRFQLSPMHVHYYYYPHHSVVQVKGNNDDIWWTGWDEKSWYELDLSCFCKYDEFIVSDSAYYEVTIFAMTSRDYSCLCHAWLAMSYNGLPCVPTCY